MPESLPRKSDSEPQGQVLEAYLLPFVVWHWGPGVEGYWATRWGTRRVKR